MKKFLAALLSCALLAAANVSMAQTINWAGLAKNDRHIAGINAGAEYAFVFGAHYGYHLPSKRPIILNAELSMPAGKNSFDDYKTKLGAEICWFRTGNFYFAANTQAVFRQYKTDYARLLNFGSDISGSAGYYKQKWFVAAQLGFDKAIATYFEHTDLFKQNFPGVQDGWYEPATGGNFYYGVLAGCSIHQTDIYIKAGKITEQDFKTSPSLPVYAQLGINVRFRNR